MNMTVEVKGEPARVAQFTVSMRYQKGLIVEVLIRFAESPTSLPSRGLFYDIVFRQVDTEVNIGGIEMGNMMYIKSEFQDMRLEEITAELIYRFVGHYGMIEDTP